MRRALAQPSKHPEEIRPAITAARIAIELQRNRQRRILSWKEEVALGSRVECAIAIDARCPHPHQSIWLAKRQRLEQHAADDGKDRRERGQR
jgi:hypothetical protein